MRVVVYALLLSCLLGQGCGGVEKEAGSWEVVGSEDLTSEQEAMRVQAREARDTLFSLLGGRLGNAMGTVGPASAISVCAEEAPIIAAEVSRKHGLTIGRTSFRLRNPKNEPPDWAKPMVAARVEQDTYLAGPEGELGVLLPIPMNDLCVTCHGRSDQISPEVKEALALKYPDDKAVGFAPDDLRGWFWVEVKPAEETP